MRYFFDLREGPRVITDEEGMELTGIERVQEEAARSLADMARDHTLQHAGNGASHDLAIEVRDSSGPVLTASFAFQVSRHKH